MVMSGEELRLKGGLLRVLRLHHVVTLQLPTLIHMQGLWTCGERGGVVLVSRWYRYGKVRQGG